MHALDPNRTGCNRSPSLLKSNVYSPLFYKALADLVDYTSSTNCINIYPIPSVLQSVFRNVGFSGSNLANIGDDVMVTFSSSKIEIRAGVQAINGIVFRCIASIVYVNDLI